MFSLPFLSGDNEVVAEGWNKEFDIFKVVDEDVVVGETVGEGIRVVFDVELKESEEIAKDWGEPFVLGGASMVGIAVGFKPMPPFSLSASKSDGVKWYIQIYLSTPSDSFNKSSLFIFKHHLRYLKKHI